MVAYTLVQRLTPNLALIGAGVAGAIVALATLAIPVPLLEDAVIASGIAVFLPAAEPPLGLTARICVGVAAGAGIAAVLWLILSVLIGIRVSRSVEPGARRPFVRRADAHPDAPPREPLRAKDLEMPRTRSSVANVEAVEESGFDDLPVPVLTEVEPDDAIVFGAPDPTLPPEPVIAMGPPPVPSSQPILELVPTPAVQPLPVDLDQPLAAFDPAAIPDTPVAPSPPVAPLRRKPRPQVYDASERFETFELTPQVREVPKPAASVSAPLSAPETDASVHALLDRLERGIVRRGERVEPEGPHGLESALDALRKLAVRA
ncbi:hypothetical protein [Sphingomonas sp. LT1P40]|uniref:hypothetical protein n=1 Tax=Alteristakelama amylovorans TaxID=3096166 RepID=UPI002FCAEE5F